MAWPAISIEPNERNQFGDIQWRVEYKQKFTEEFGVFESFMGGTLTGWCMYSIIETAKNVAKFLSANVGAK